MNVKRFIIDQMLIRLGRWLRLLGLDVSNPVDADDRELIARAEQEKRTLITRDKSLAEACRSAGTSCILIQSSRLEDQLKEISRLGIALDLDPQRCTLCNNPLQEVPSRLPFYEKMWKCDGCGKLYWHGSHWRRIEETLNKIRYEK